MYDCSLMRLFVFVASSCLWHHYFLLRWARSYLIEALHPWDGIVSMTKSFSWCFAWLYRVEVCRPGDGIINVTESFSSWYGWLYLIEVRRLCDGNVLVTASLSSSFARLYSIEILRPRDGIVHLKAFLYPCYYLWVLLGLVLASGEVVKNVVYGFPTVVVLGVFVPVYLI